MDYKTQNWWRDIFKTRSTRNDVIYEGTYKVDK